MNRYSPHRRIDHWIRTHPGRVDIITGSLVTLFCVPTGMALGFQYHTTYAFGLALISVAQTVPLMVRRRWPWAATLVIAAAHILQLGFGGVFLPSQISVPIMIYTMAVFGKRWQSFATLGLGILGAVLATGLIFSAVPQGPGLTFDSLISFVGLSLVVLVSWTFGDLARTRRLAYQSLADRAKRLEQERQYERDLAASDERNHIAREMHDIVAHSLSVIITQADGARYAAAQDPQIAIDTLKTVSDTGRTSLREMRRLLGVLRTDEAAENRPLPTLSDIPDLVASYETSGLSVSSYSEGTARRSLPAGAELTAYRCVQESLTNVLKHAGPNAHANVILSWQSRGLLISVEDNGRGAGALTHEGTGQGLRGMCERVALYDGTASAGPKTGGGFAVSVFIPYSED
ncbi:sensor histidine kinase [Glutamicibacter sp. X7]